MNDHIKIQVLMIYFKHWGNEQTHLRKVIHGIQKTTQLLKQNFNSFNKLSQMNMKELSFWQYLSEALLPNMSHYLPYDDIEDLRLLYLRAQFADAIGSSFFFPHLVNINENQMRRINAIIALPCL